MRTPPGLIGFALAWWGIQTGWYWAGIAAGAILELSRISATRWEFGHKGAERAWDLCAWLFFLNGFIAIDSIRGGLSLAGTTGAGTGEALRLGVASSKAIVRVFEGLPWVFLPIQLIEAWGFQGGFRWDTFSWYLRRCRRDGHPYEGEVHFSWIYLGLVVAAACTAAAGPKSLLIALLVAGWALWTARQPKPPVWRWGLSFAMAAGIAWGFRLALVPIGAWIQSQESALLSRWMESRTQPTENRTAIGQLGRIQDSGAIVHRIQATRGPLPSLLRDSTYESYRAGTWFNAARDSLSPAEEHAAAIWRLGPTPPGDHDSIRIWCHGGQGVATLPVPPGAYELESRFVAAVETNRLGMVRAAGTPFLPVEFRFSRQINRDGPPTDEDLKIPETERDVIDQTALELGLDPSMPATLALDRIHAHFSSHFRYSLWQRKAAIPSAGETALGKFLGQTHEGHCEFFATAATLLLRRAGIPARYAVGWSVPPGDASIIPIRARHAHAWAIAHVNGLWRDIDATPSSPATHPTGRRLLEPFSDALSRLVFEFQRFRHQHAVAGAWTPWAIGGAAVILAGIVVRQARHHRKPGATAPPNGSRTKLPEDGFDELDQFLAGSGQARHPTETWRAWLQRVQITSRDAYVGLVPLISAHEQFYYDPQPSGEEGWARIRQEVRNWIDQQPIHQPASRSPTSAFSASGCQTTP